MQYIQKKKEKDGIENQILLEQSQHPAFKVADIRFFLSQFKKGDINDLKYRQALIDTFVNKIYLYDDKMTIRYNVQDSHSVVDLDEQGSSTVELVDLGRHHFHQHS